jgi:chromosome partition protein MukB
MSAEAVDTRTRAVALTLVNWKGVFFNRYELDPMVTALEGANGAGKTTVMIAAYVVLLPDMSRLRFTNVGETGATGGDRGIYGRLGVGGRPAFAAMEFEVAGGERFMACVRLERRGEPTVEPTPFIISDLPAGSALHRLLLRESGGVESVIDLDEMRVQVAAAGGRMRVFPTAREYFAELFERGVLPLRLQTDEDRSKFNEMLRTSMVGGISRALTGGMREFLLREETGLADTLKRMRQNLDACRKTRREVEDARRVEHEIHGVWDAGQSMFASVVHATRSEAEERRLRVDEARRKLDGFEARRAELERQVDAAQHKVRELAARREASKVAADDLEGLLDRTRRAWDVARRVARMEREAGHLGREADEKAQALKDMEQQRDTAQRTWDDARAALAAAGRGIADLKAGLEEVERRAAQHRLARERLAHVTAALPGTDVEAEGAAVVASRVEAQLRGLDEELVRVERALSVGAMQRTEYQKVLASLERLTGMPAVPVSAELRAREVLAELRAIEAVVEQLPNLPKRLEQKKRDAASQAAARAVADGLGHYRGPADVEAALAAAEVAETAADDALKAARAQAESELRGATEGQRRVRELEPLTERWRVLRERTGVTTRAALLAARVATLGRRDEVRARRVEDERARDGLRRRIHALQVGSGGLDDSLAAARDLVSGELFVERFEDVAVDGAAELEARLGTWRQAVVVVDPAAAASQLAAAMETTSELPTDVRLLSVARSRELEEGGAGHSERVGPAVVVREEAGVVRVSRLPAQPVVGRRAREAALERLRGDFETLGLAIEAARAEEASLSERLAALDGWLPDAELLERADPAPELEAARLAAETAVAARKVALAQAEKLAREAEDLKRRKAALRRLLGEAHWLEAADVGAEVLTLERQLAQARAGETRLRLATADRRVVELGLDVLRAPPPGEAELAAQKTRRQEVSSGRDDLSGVLERLRWLAEHKAALGWADAEVTLRQSEAVRPALEAQLHQAEALATSSEAELKDAIERALRAQDAASRARGAWHAHEAALEATRRELAESGIEDASRDAVEVMEARAKELRLEAAALEQQEREVRAETVRFEERVRQALDLSQDARWRLTVEEQAWQPAAQRWNRLRELASARGVLAAAYHEGGRKELASLGSAEAWVRARARAGLVVERLGRLKDGQEPAWQLRAFLDQLGAGLVGAPQDRQLTERQATIASETAGGETAGGPLDATEPVTPTRDAAIPGAVEGWLEAWIRVRDWLRRRVPAQVAEVDDPLEALGRLREHLARLEERLSQQEKTLRGQSNDVARHIDTQMRRARSQVTRLNGDLDGVGFGSIEAMQVRVRPVERMEAVLRALREGVAQQLLFEPNLPIEEALDELFRRYGGGRTGGDRLLDYREYLDLQVEIRRQAGGTWELANPTRLSTGEAIGVGAAVMMAVLKSWEHDAMLLRKTSERGSLRLLFLDEATRLSQDNLGILFELCEKLELQLLIAAPEVARAGGNTTYRLVRILGPDGTEEVRSSGRRLLRGAVAAERAEA